MRYVSTAYLASQSCRNADSKPLFEVAPLFAPLWCFGVMKIKLYQRNGADAENVHGGFSYEKAQGERG